jgi:hypothetical protein
VPYLMKCRRETPREKPVFMRTPGSIVRACYRA